MLYYRNKRRIRVLYDGFKLSSGCIKATKPAAYHFRIVHILFIDTGDTVLEQGCRYRCRKMYINFTILSKTANLTLQILETKPKFKGIVHFYLAFL